MNSLHQEILINNVSYTLEDLEKDCWTRLVNGSVKSRDPFHTPCVATLSNMEVSVRTVVLRKVSPLEKTIRFHTDIRSNKWKELTLNNSISLLFYDAPSRIQLRLKGKAILCFNDEITKEAWEKTPLSSRRCYLTNAKPASFSDIPTSGLSESIEQEKISLEDSEIGQQHFGIVSVQVESIDWLWLHHAGHRRAFFDYVQQSNYWMVP